jgi:hypothetical protein
MSYVAVLNENFTILMECVDYIWENRKTVTYDDVVDRFDSLDDEMFEYIFVDFAVGSDDYMLRKTIKSKEQLLAGLLFNCKFYEEFIKKVEKKAR